MKVLVSTVFVLGAVSIAPLDLAVGLATLVPQVALAHRPSPSRSRSIVYPRWRLTRTDPGVSPVCSAISYAGVCLP